MVWIFWFCIVAGVLLCLGIGFAFGYSNGQQDMRMAAVSQGVGKWVVYNNGLITFAWDDRYSEALAKIIDLEGQLSLAKDPMVIDEARWLDERNAGAENLATALLNDKGGGTMSGKCGEAQAYVRRLREQTTALRKAAKWFLNNAEGTPETAWGVVLSVDQQEQPSV